MEEVSEPVTLLNLKKLNQEMLLALYKAYIENNRYKVRGTLDVR